MKTIWTLFLALFISANFATAQDTLYVYKTAEVIFKQAVTGVDSITFKNSPSNTVTDIDGNVYKTVKIGTQTWMAENLRTVRYRNYEYIANTPWNYTSTGLYCDFNNDPNLGILNGHIYNWYAATDVRSIAPVGWHVPSNEEWATLANSLGGANVAGTKMKETGTTHWYSPNNYATNESGFNALPGGMRDAGGTFSNYQNGYYKTINWWSTTSSYYNSAGCIQVTFDYPNLFISTTQRDNGCYIRCVKD